MRPPTSHVISRDELLLALFALALGTFMTWYAYSLDLTKALTDQSAHLNFSRLTFDSLTPGISQIGFWPPLLHILLIPFVALPALYATGLAGSLALIPFLCLGTVFLCRTCYLLTNGNRFLSAVAGILFCLNPYVLYYAATPMMEVLFLANLFGVAYFLALWLKTDRLRYLLLTAIFVSLASLSRFEGLMLLPITSIIVGVQLLRQRTGWARSEALLLLFGLLLVIGLGFIVTYSWIFGGSPLAFSGGSWLRDPVMASGWAGFSLMNSVAYVLYASFYMLGTPLVLIALAGTVILAVVSRQRFLDTAVLMVLLSPMAFVMLSMFLGLITIAVPDLPPFSGFHNDRYALTWIGFAIMAPLLAIHHLYGRMTHGRLTMKTHVGVNALMIFTAIGMVHLYGTAVARKFEVITRNVNSPTPDQREVAYYLRERYDNGLVLTSRVDNDPVIANAGVPLDRYIYEGNYRYFDQALSEPWLFATWVIMHSAGNDPWVAQNEAVFRQWGESDEFKGYYDLVLENAGRRVYRLNDSAVIRLSQARGYDVRDVPSLNRDSRPWNPSNVYAFMREQAPGEMNAVQLASHKSLSRTQLLAFYENRLKPDYERGYYAAPDGRGNSESQSYAMLQSLWNDDRETFDRVWEWTKTNLQKDDGLFMWKFAVGDGGGVIPEDTNSATDADTDIAYALLQAGTRWSDPEYITDAKRIMDAIWAFETAETAHGRHVIAGNWAANGESLVLNPSYVTPYAYRLFARHDSAHDWYDVVETGYEDLRKASDITKKRDGELYLPPDWIEMDRATGEVQPFLGKSNSMDYSYDAFRTFWRVAMDDMLSHSGDAHDYLEDSDVFAARWKKDDRVCSVYKFSTPDDLCQVDVGTLAGPLSIWSRTQPQLTSQLLQQYHFAGNRIDMAGDSAFYEKSWYWFGLWLWTS